MAAGRIQNFFSALLVAFAATIFLAGSCKAAPALTYVSDLISSSNPGVSTDHIITFSTPSSVPPSGKILLIPQTGAFNIPAGMDYSSVDFATSPARSGPFTDRNISSVPSPSDDGVSVVSGTSGSIVITLNSSLGLAEGGFVKIEIGLNASYGDIGTAQILNPARKRSYKILFQTQDGSGAVINETNDWVAIVNPVQVGPVNTFDFDPPVRFNGMPSGTSIPAGIRWVMLSLETDEWATCRYSKMPDIPYDSMTSTFAVTGYMFHSIVVDDLYDVAWFHHYVKCVDTRGNSNPDDYDLAFYVATPLGSPGPGAGRGPGPGGGTPGQQPVGIAGGFPYPPLAGPPELEIDGWAYPSSFVMILKDGAFIQDVKADSDGRFSVDFTGITQGLYTFGIWAKDSVGRKSIIFSPTVSLMNGTKTHLTNILLPPTVEVSQYTVGDNPIDVFGESAPGSDVEVNLVPADASGYFDEANAVRKTMTADEKGAWKITLAAEDLIAFTYELRVRAFLPDTGYSVYGEAVELGNAKSVSFCRKSDLNDDGKVNFVDFSILLFNWGKDNPRVDINGDGKINLADFSIMLTCWTG
jgi:hypothetical protein